MIKVNTKKGEKLSASFIKKWSETMTDAFGGDEILDVKDKKKYSKDKFFIATDKKKIVSMGRLIPIKIKFAGKDYDIKGIAGIVSVEKGKGYGKALMTSIKKYLEKNKKTAIGFCGRKNDGFYIKCGFKIKKNISERFIYTNENGKAFWDNEGDDVVYLEGKDKFMEKILSNKLNIDIPIMPW